ncbi:gamma-glutamylputrescine oxidase [Rhodovulum bhavnagarense]|uniref:Gamma-glutamylputrescine oxidase n=1 Tax=Rhodovulum bhavnagarense TaxID=992286 RepID=A0A4R2RT68_9RHOB|nr:FAD-binding oxidoreductase [Rhodovulum bhavnagarense]TCP63081.1 gamma-glutamylputrescine oxidase [Rhodovulum bhavnagarense]
MNLLFSNDRPGAYPASWYAAVTPPLPPFAPARGEIRADICVVGGGYTGLSAALHLAQAGADVVLVEAHRMGFGASGRNGGQVGTGQRLHQDELEQRLGDAHAARLWHLAEDAKALVARLIADHAIACDYRPGIVEAEWTASGVSHAHAYAEKLLRDYEYDLIEPLGCNEIAALIGSPVYKGGVVDWGAGHLNPLAFALGLARAAAAAGAHLHENSVVTAIEPGARPVVLTDKARITADKVIVAANGYLGNLVPQVAAHVMPINNFVVATAPLDAGTGKGTVLAREVAVADSKFVINYFRPTPDGRLLFGGGESYGYRFPRDIRAVVRKPLAQVFPQLADVELTHAWGGTLAITRTRLPHLAAPAPGLLSASGYSGHGVALATLAGRLLAEASRGSAADFETMTNLPCPRFPGGSALRQPLLVLAMSWFALRDRLGL